MDRKEGIIITEDFNAHNKVWNCANTDRIGDELFEDFLEKDLFIVNKDTGSRLGEGNQRNSNINLIFYTDNIFDKVHYEQGDDTFGSFSNKI